MSFYKKNKNNVRWGEEGIFAKLATHFKECNKKFEKNTGISLNKRGYL
jgi:hypothetical protein